MIPSNRVKQAIIVLASLGSGAVIALLSIYFTEKPPDPVETTTLVTSVVNWLSALLTETLTGL